MVPEMVSERGCLKLVPEVVRDLVPEVGLEWEVLLGADLDGDRSSVTSNFQHGTVLTEVA